MGKSFGFMDIDIECKSISISADIAEAEKVSYIVQIQDTENIFVLAYPQPLTGSGLY